MVVINSRTFKHGIAMIELIFAIVIMGIVLLSAPMLIQQSIRSGNVAIQQEAIAAAAAQTSVILSMHWDENNNSNSAVSPMLNVNRAPFNFSKNVAPLGLTNVTGRTSISLTGETLPAVREVNFGPDITGNPDTNESDFTKFDDVDDYHNSQLNLTIYNNESTSSDIGDYIDANIKIDTTINYAEDRVNTNAFIPLTGINIPNMGKRLNLNNKINSTSIGTRSNIKFIHVNLTSSSGEKSLDKNITFEAFSCNIGTTKALGANY